MSGEPIDSCRLRANSHCRTRLASTLGSLAIRVASAHARGVLAGVQKGSRPMKPSNLVCGSASLGTSILAPY